jgi:hypothetical protein
MSLKVETVSFNLLIVGDEINYSFNSSSDATAYESLKNSKQMKILEELEKVYNRVFKGGDYEFIKSVSISYNNIYMQVPGHSFKIPLYVVSDSVETNGLEVFDTISDAKKSVNISSDDDYGKMEEKISKSYENNSSYRKDIKYEAFTYVVTIEYYVNRKFTKSLEALAVYTYMLYLLFLLKTNEINGINPSNVFWKHDSY